MRQTGHLGAVGTLTMAVLFAAGCASQSGSGTGAERTGHEERIGEQPIKEIDRDRSPSASQTSPATPSELAARNASGLAGESLLDVLFDFDRDTLRADALPVLESNAKRLKQDSVVRVLLEGRGDEIGTSAYNIVLGERRARNVKDYLHQLGLAAELKTTSYGKDRPLCFEHTSECMQKNRSVHFVVKE